MLFQQLFKRNHTGQPDVPISDLLNPSSWLRNALTGGDSNMSPKKALNNSNVFTCVSILANDIAKLPIHTFKGDGDRVNGMKHPVAKLLYLAPNPLMSAFTFKQLLEMHVGIYGNGYALIVFDKGGYPKELWPLDPSTTKPVLQVSTGELFYETINAAGKVTHYKPHEILHFKGLSIDGIVGRPPWQTLIDELFGQDATKQFISGFYKNGTLSSGVLKTDSKLNREAKEVVRNEWQRVNGGVSNAGNIAVLDVGLDYKPIGMALDQAQFIETQKFGINEVAKVYQIPPHKLAQMDRATYSNAEVMGLEYIKTTLLPIFVQWEQEIHKKLFTNKEREQYYVKFNAAAELRGDSSARASYYKDMVNTGIMSINEIRALEELSKVDGDMGDKHFISLNYTTLDAIEELQMAKVGSLKGGEGDGEGTQNSDNNL